MKNFSLIILMCLSLNLNLLAAIPHGNPAAGQRYANSAQAQITSAQNNLQANYSNLSNLMNSMEKSLCGISVDDGGLVVNTTGSGSSATYSYANCNGGAMAAYSSWSNQINYWGNIINPATAKGSWEAGYDACAVSYSGPSGYSTNFYNDLSSSTVTNDMGSISSVLNSIVGCALPAGGSQQGACPVGATAALPDNVTLANNLIQTIMDIMDDMSNAINTNNVFNLVAPLTLNGSVTKAVNSAYNLFNNCYNSNIANNPNACPQNIPCGDDCGTLYCTNELQGVFNAVQAQTNAVVALYDALLAFLPFSAGSYTMDQSVASKLSSSFSCVMPNACSDITGACTYNVTSFNFDQNSSITQLTNYINQVTNTTKAYYANVNGMAGRLNALLGQLKVLGADIQSLQTQTTNIINNCKKDITEYQQEVAEKSMIINIVVGTILGMVLIPLTGGLGVAGLEELTMILLQIPQINNYTLGKLTQILSQQIAKVTPGP